MKRLSIVVLAMLLVCLLASCGPSFAYVDLQALPGGTGFTEKMAGSADTIRGALESKGIRGTDIVWDDKGSLSVRFGSSQPFPAICNAIIGLVQESHFLEIKKADGTLVFSSSDFAAATPDTGADGAAVLAFQLKEDAARSLAQATQAPASPGSPLQVYYDGKLLARPLTVGTITDGKGVIKGFENAQQAADIAQKVLNSPLPLRFGITKMVRRAME